MRLFALAIVTLCLLGFVPTQPPRARPMAPTTHVSAAELAELSVYLEFKKGHCTATKVGPSMLAFDGHCLLYGGALEKIDGTPAKGLSVTHDGNDHVLVIVDRVFTRWAQLGPPPKLGDRVHAYGNPHDLRGVYRQGYVAAISDALPRCPEMATVTKRTADGTCAGTLYDFPVGGGDSGAGVFDDQGRLVGIIFGNLMIDEVDTMTVALPIAFTPEQWAGSKEATSK